MKEGSFCMKEIKVFISYAHDDDTYLKIFKKGIEKHSGASRNFKWTIWSDKEIPVGVPWHNAIQNEIEACDAAILLVSANFMASNYIENEEFSKFLQKSSNRGFVFLPVLLTHCNFTSWKKLSERQFFNPKSEDYGVSDYTDDIMPYSCLVSFDDKGRQIRHPFIEKYHQKCVETFEKAILFKQKPPTPSCKVMRDVSDVDVLQENIRNAVGSNCLARFILHHAISHDIADALKLFINKEFPGSIVEPQSTFHYSQTVAGSINTGDYCVVYIAASNQPSAWFDYVEQLSNEKGIRIHRVIAYAHK